MGISDKDYADALEHQRVHQVALMKLEIDKQRLRMQTGAGAGSVYTGVRPINEEDLQHDAMKAPLSALVDMWTMRWGGEWVNESAIQEDDFWRLALIRLTGANKLEKHNMANQYHPVYRIIE